MLTIRLGRLLLKSPFPSGEALRTHFESTYFHSEESKEDKQLPKVAIFLNAFFSPEDPTAGIEIVEEQVRQINKSHLAADQKQVEIHITSMGNELFDNATRVQEFCNNISNVQCIHDNYLKQGYEIDTLSRLYEYCQANTNGKAIYIHNKGSFHPSLTNMRWRRAMLDAVTDRSCVSADNACNVCGLQFAAPPRMFSLLFPGNFFVASCSYVNQLYHPKPFYDEMVKLHERMRLWIRQGRLNCYLKARKPWNIGSGRYTPEHWIASHPNVSPCDLSTHVDYWYWRKHNHSRDEFQWSMFPRPGLNNTLEFDGQGVLMQNNPDLRLREYFLLPGLFFRWLHLYNATPPDDSWIWKWFPDGAFWKAAFQQYGYDALNIVTAPDYDRNGTVTTLIRESR